MTDQQEADSEKKQRKEDVIIAWTWKTFILKNSSDPEILLHMPMTKAAVRALNTIATVATAKVGKTVNKFLVAGASKRGWTTWTTGAVDKRVIAIAPIVMDLLNMVKNLHHHYQSLGGWTFAFGDYYDVNFTRDLDNQNTKKMANIIDTISYNDRFINKPKYIITTGGDEFFIPDDSDYFFDQLNGPKYLRKLPNAEHSCFGHVISLLFSLRAYFLSVILNEPLPKMEWIKVTGNGTFQVEFENPKEGWIAFFIQVTFPGLMGSVLEFTTQAMIIPNTFPFEDCHEQKCLGELV